MKKFLRRVICASGIIPIILSLCFTAFAEQVTVYEPTLKGEEITVSGSLPAGYGGQDVTIQIISPGGTLGDPDDIWYIREVKSSTDGSFSLTVLMKNDAPGIYTVYAGSKNLSPSELTPRADTDGYIEAFYYIPKKSRDEFVEKINGAADAETIALLLEDESLQPVIKNIGLFIASYKELNDNNKKNITEALLHGNFNEEELYKAFNDAIIVEILNSAPDAEETFKNARQFSDYLCIDYTQYDERKDDENTRLFLDEYIAAKKGGGWRSAADFTAAFNDVWLLADINRETSYKNIWNIIEKNIAQFNFDSAALSYYKDLKNEADIYSVNKALTNRHFMSKEAVETAFKNAVDALRNGGNTSNNTGGSASTGGSGSGSKGGAAIIAPAADDSVQDTGTNKFFDDVLSTHWAYDSILKLKERGIIDGNESGKFEPERILTREIFVTMLSRGLQLSDGREEMHFTDVSDGDWFYPYILSAVNAHIVRGFDDGSFGVGREITRQDMAVMIYRSAKYLGIDMADEDSETKFTDDEAIALYAREAVYSLKNMNVINGMDDDSYSPQGLSTKAQAAALICRILELRR